MITAIRYTGVAYLLYLAWQLCHAPVHRVESKDVAPDGSWRLSLARLSIQLGNPKALAFFLAPLPTVVDLQMLTIAGFAELGSIIIIIVYAVFETYTIRAARAVAPARLGDLPILGVDESGGRIIAAWAEGEPCEARMARSSVTDGPAAVAPLRTARVTLR